ncbi:MAG: GtrA family protein [Muribaculaceae bacterium]|nr:GtrA family protein [Muribaculaceae bacterium]
MPNIFVRYAKFAGTSVVGTIVDTLVLWLLSDFAFSKGYWGEYILSPFLSFQVAVFVNFAISYFYVWKDRVKNNRSTRHFFKLYLKYNLSCSAVLLTRMLCIIIIERFSGWDVVICNLIAMCFSGLANFILTNSLVFKKK